MNIRMPRSIVLAAGAALLALAVPSVVYRKTVYKPALNQTEQALVAFTPSQLNLVRKEWQPAPLRQPLSSGVPTPAPATAAASAQAALPPSPPAPPPTLSFILQDGGTSMAIIGGSMVKTGDRVKDWQVERIERNRVLLRNRKGATWLTLD